MKINLSVQDYPMCVSFTCFSGQANLIRSIELQKSVTILVDFNTKTTLNVSLLAGDSCLKASYIPQGCDNMKFLTKTTYSYFHDKTTTCNHFKILKSQKWEEFKRYILALIESLHINAEELNVRICMANSIRELLNAPNYDTH